jgi:hypothetical protein
VTSTLQLYSSQASAGLIHLGGVYCIMIGYFFKYSFGRDTGFSLCSPVLRCINRDTPKYKLTNKTINQKIYKINIGCLIISPAPRTIKANIGTTMSVNILNLLLYFFFDRKYFIKNIPKIHKSTNIILKIHEKCKKWSSKFNLIKNLNKNLHFNKK